VIVENQDLFALLFIQQILHMKTKGFLRIKSIYPQLVFAHKKSRQPKLPGFFIFGLS